MCNHELFCFLPSKLITKVSKDLKVISYRQSQTEDGGGVVKVVDHFIGGCVVHLHMSERKSVRYGLEIRHRSNGSQHAVVVCAVRHTHCAHKYLSREADSSLCPLLLRHKQVTVL